MRGGKFGLLVWCLLACVGGVLAGPVVEMRDWAGLRGGETGVVIQLAFAGITNAVDQAAIRAGWDEDVMVDAGLRAKAYDFVNILMSRAKVSPANMQKIKSAVTAENTAPVRAVDIAMKYPAAERGDFRHALEAVAPVRYAKQPEYGRLLLKYSLLQGVSIYGPAVGVDEVTRVLLAPELLPLGDAERFKQMIKERAVRLARLKLRAEGKTFVVQNGVNPLLAKVEPVVSALNAAECAGLEAALRGLGADVADVDRGDLQKLAAQWQADLLSGDLSGDAALVLLGKLSVALGPEGYNAFVDEYNNGKAGGP